MKALDELEEDRQHPVKIRDPRFIRAVLAKCRGRQFEVHVRVVESGQDPKIGTAKGLAVLLATILKKVFERLRSGISSKMLIYTTR